MSGATTSDTQPDFLHTAKVAVLVQSIVQSGVLAFRPENKLFALLKTVHDFFGHGYLHTLERKSVQIEPFRNGFRVSSGRPPKSTIS